MNDRQAYYSIVQYSEYPERAEFVNIGVIIFQRAAPLVMAKFVQTPKKIEAVFKVHMGDRFADLLASLSSRVTHEFEDHWEQSSLTRFAAMRTGKARMTEPRSILVLDATKSLDKLFAELVSDYQPMPRRPKVTQKLKMQLLKLGVEQMLERPAPVDLHGVTLRAPYAYQNGRYNMINGLSLTDDPDRAIQAASNFAIKGAWLFESQAIRPSRLVVVADVEGQREDFTYDVSKMMEKHNVGFHRLSDLRVLADDIRDHVASNAFRPFS